MQTKPVGPITRGVVDLANASAAQGIAGAARVLRAFRYQGAQQLVVREGTATKMTLYIEGGGQAVTSVCALVPFADWALAVGHDAIGQVCYLYRLAADMSGWYASDGTFTANQNAQPVGTLWDSIPDPPDVFIAEGLGLGYIAHTQALDATTLAFPTKQYTVPGAIATLQGGLNTDGSGALVDLYFRGVVSYNQHLWGWSFGTGPLVTDAFRPEMARFSLPNFAGFQTSDSITLGDRVRSQREQIVGGVVAGKALFLGGPFGLDRITGYGRASWFKEPLSKTFGFPGPKCYTVRSDELFWWSPNGPCRCLDMGKPVLIRLPVEGAVANAINPETVCVGYDPDRDLVIFVYDAGTTRSVAGVRTWFAYDATRDVWVGPDDDIGLDIRYISTVSPVFASAAARTSDGTQIGKPGSPPVQPNGAPSGLSTTDVTHSSAIAHWVNADITALTRIDIRRTVDLAWTTQAIVDPGTAQYTISGLVSGVAYEWRVAHVRGGLVGDFTGPSSDTQFTTTAVDPGQPLDTPSIGTLDSVPFGGFDSILVSWSNPTSGSSTEVWVTPSVSPGPPVDADFTLNQTATPLQSTAAFSVFSSGRYWVRVRAVEDAFTPSAFSDPVSIDVIVTGSIT